MTPRAACVAGISLIACVVLLPRVAPAATATVAVKGNAFAPVSVSISVNDTVDWRYAVGDGREPHTVTADDGSFDSGYFAPGQSYAHTFTEPGTVRYYCTLHGGPGGEGMAGVVVVKAAGQQHSSSPKPSPSKTSTNGGSTATPTGSARATAGAGPSATASGAPVSPRGSGAATSNASTTPTTLAGAPIGNRDDGDGSGGSRGGSAVLAALALMGVASARVALAREQLRLRPRRA